MVNLSRDFFIALSNNKFLNKNAKRWGFRLGANKFVPGTEIDEVIGVIKKLNQAGISCTLDHLGEFVFLKEEAIKAKKQILYTLDRIYVEQLDCHISVKLTQLGLDINSAFCVENMLEILNKANQYNIFINIDMEDYSHYEPTLEILKELRKHYENVGTVIQSYLYRSKGDLEKLKDVRIRIVKGAYKENNEVAYQTKDEIDREFISLAKERLLGHSFTSIATHDHHIIQELIHFINENGVSQDRFEFQMLYGFRTELQYKLTKEGYNFCTYIPFGTDWFGYFMRRLAERPQNINLIVKDKLYTKDNRLKKQPIVTSAIIVLSFIFWRKKSKR
ncbi:proline dehydrogenase family protein [Oceanobacillus caeni]|uniref:proline dehydrogenase n=1 Tax=Oceanobacillus caeni TaxID=405946 RepID=A0ABR5MFQ1_9BACI|nr:MULTISPECIES: proline dehydrogenase family protein [Bacillaceae]KKE80191.1 proline dehydrogenase [Bacilli bacterium VT-13-104]PZD83421.1 proline dehydrogenase [Bacilli bacterium]KPH71180.1 proline dehydrogenase [Oceanobacillus caeni]MBU8792145.1 proline dehydrogenase family protein [Oceanobacillus caeni]MCR1835370.1 proline dehydrogenase family protein [Oceanobacillus caeni]